MFGQQEKEKKCRICNQNKPLSCYSKHAQSKDGRCNECKDCAKKRTREWYKNNREKAIKTTNDWAKNNPEKRKEQRKKYREKNREKLQQARRERYQRNKEREKKNCKEWQKKNLQKFRHAQNLCKMKRRHKIKNTKNKITYEQWQDLILLHESKCFYCKQFFEKLTMDHLNPLSRGGDHSIENIVPACLICNSTKNNKTLEEFLNGHR